MQLFALETMRDRYWHNMAGRIQRAWRNYMRYKHECARRIQRFLSQPMFVAEVFTGIPGRYVKLKDTIASFKAIVDGEADDLPEAAFFMAGDLEDVRRQAKKMEEGRNG